MEKHLHIVCLQVPYPPDYGGVIDLFYKLKYLHERGIIIHLHCFEYGRGEQGMLLQYCSTVQYYKRTTGIAGFSFALPYIVASRKDKKLEERLAADDYPILLEGIHCTYLLHQGNLANRKVLLRLHNIEAAYYQQLYDTATAVFSKWYYAWESRLLKRYERQVIKKAGVGLTVSVTDAAFWQREGIGAITYLPVFTAWNEVNSLVGKGQFCLYQGNLSVEENEKAVCWLLQHVFAFMDIPLVVAGKNPGRKLKAALKKYPHIRLVENPGPEAMEQLIRDAQVNLLPSFTTSGIKLKLLHALFCGRHCLVNSNMVNGTDLQDVCFVADDPTGYRNAVNQLFETPFTEAQLQLRRAVLATNFNNRENADRLIQYTWQ